MADHMAHGFRLLYISDLYPPHVVGGAEVMAAQLAENMAARGHSVTVLSTQPSQAKPNPTTATVRGVCVVRFFPDNLYWPFDRGHPPLWKRVIWHTRNTWNTGVGRVLDQVIGAQRPDIVHTHNMASFSPIVWERVQAHGLPVVHTAHDYQLLCPRTTLRRTDGRLCDQPAWPCQAYRWWQRRQAANIDCLVAPSAFLLEKCRAAGVPARQFAKIPYGLPLWPLEPAVRRQPFASGGRPLKLLFMGQVTAHKGVDVLLDAFRALPENAAVELRVAGVGSLEQAVQKACHTDQRVRYLGFLSGDAKDLLLEETDVLVVPSVWFDNYPVVVIEAMMRGVVVVASRIGGLPEMVEDGVTGFLFTSGDRRDLAGILLRLLDNPHLHARMSINARQAGMAHDVNTMTARYQAIYNDLVNARRSDHPEPSVATV